MENENPPPTPPQTKPELIPTPPKGILVNGVNLGLTAIQIVELRMKLLDPIIKAATAASLMGKDKLIGKRGEDAWNFAIKPLLSEEDQKKLNYNILVTDAEKKQIAIDMQ